MPSDTNIMNSEPPGLIDHAAVAAADAARDATLRRAHEARLAHARAEADLRAAHGAADDAAAVGGDVATAEDVVFSADRAMRIAARVLSAAEAAAAQAPDIHRRAIGAAHLGAAFDAIHRRLAATRDHEAALAAVENAKKAFATATSDLLDCVNLGTTIRGGRDCPRVLPSAALEVAHWAANGINLPSHLGASS